MDYDPIKNRLGDLVEGRPWMTRLFYSVLQLLFLRNWYVRRELNRIIKGASNRKSLRILDAGTGFGQFCYYLVKRYPTLTIDAVDVKEDYLERAELFASEGLTNRVSFSIDDLTELQANGPFDLIVSVDVMEHIEEDEQVFRNFRNVLAPGGRVLINTPSDLGGSGVDEAEGESFIGEHVRDGYNLDELRRKLRVADLDVVHAMYTYGSPGKVAWRLLIKYPMMMMGKSRLFLALLPLYYIPVFPVGMLLNYWDMLRINKRGTGLLVVAEATDR